MIDKERNGVTTIDFVLKLFQQREEKQRTNHVQVVEKIAMNTNIKKELVAQVLTAIPFVIRDSLELEGDVVSIKGVGTWSLVKRKVNKMLKNSPDKDYILSVSAKTSRSLVPYNKQKGKTDAK